MQSSGILPCNSGAVLVPDGASVNAKDHVWLTPLHRAAASRNERAVSLLLRQGAEVNARDKFWQTPLHVAAANRATRCAEALLPQLSSVNEAVANELVNRGANVNQPNLRGYSPLHLAAVSTNGALCLELLVNNGADVNMQSKEGKSPLHMAAIHGRFTRSQILIQNGGEIDCVDKYGNTPLHVAAKYGHELLISTLMTNGADTARQGIHGMFPLHLAVLYGFSDCCRKLLSSGQLYSIVSSLSNEHVLSAGFDINTPDNFGRTCLHAAASGGNVECLNLLLSSGADLSRKDKFGRTPLHYAAANGNSACLVTLVSAGAEVNQPDSKGCTPLHYAAAAQAFRRVDKHYAGSQQSEEERAKETFICLEYLLDNGADPSVRNIKGYSAVHYAAAHGNKQNLELTLVSLDVRDGAGRTALYLAAQRGHCQCVEVLLAHGASCLLKEARRKWTPLHVAGTNQTPLMLAVLGSHTDCVHLLLEKGATADAGDKRGRTALHRGAVMGCEDCVLALLDHSAFPLCRDFQGRTPLHLAASCGHGELLGSLLQAATHTDPLDSLLDYSGYTPSHWAAYHGQSAARLRPFLFPLHVTQWTAEQINGHEGAAELLLENAGAQMVNSRDSKGRTPLHAAAFAENVAGLQLALCQGAEVNAVDHTGRSALMVAADNGQTAAVGECRGTVVNQERMETGHEMCALLILGEIHNPTLVNATNSALQMPLHIAARNGLATVVQALLSRGATVLAVDEEGESLPPRAHDRIYAPEPTTVFTPQSPRPYLPPRAHDRIYPPEPTTVLTPQSPRLYLPPKAHDGIYPPRPFLPPPPPTPTTVLTPTSLSPGHTPALACAPNKDVADCLALILSTMKPFPPKDPSGAPFSLNLLKHCGITAACSPLPNGNLRHGYSKERHGAIGLDGCFSE
ncbi:hypothetical protein JZ751_009306 [Albula glossodonta]|uniref:Ankyrin repeat domain 52 n=1 Tax=Albula glossodonta TaxID=121402 RepID=A0A8T2N3I4_9TELE|nr:hypothetical protein JZ751_009306 [Albula glossodonta]